MTAHRQKGIQNNEKTRRRPANSQPMNKSQQQPTQLSHREQRTTIPGLGYYPMDGQGPSISKDTAAESSPAPFAQCRRLSCRAMHLSIATHRCSARAFRLDDHITTLMQPRKRCTSVTSQHLLSAHRAPLLMQRSRNCIAMPYPALLHSESVMTTEMVAAPWLPHLGVQHLCFHR